jgi:taurine transport system permease protein
MVPAIALSTAGGVRSVPLERINAARTLGASRWQVLAHVVLPNALPEILVGTRIGLAVGWSTLVAAELVAAQRGLGFMIWTASNFLITDVVLVGILSIAAIAFAMEFVMRALERRLTPWKDKQ